MIDTELKKSLGRISLAVYCCSVGVLGNALAIIALIWSLKK
jgi:hypothetical protein